MLKIDITREIGEFKDINGINNGPICCGSTINSSKYYKQAGFTYCRLHDTNWPHPREVDIHTIFKDFTKDENDPKNYDFLQTDLYIKSIIDIGAKIIYRLGVSIEHAKPKIYTHPPADFDKWARICLNIARHYNEGWANGFHYEILHWEVWNEPDTIRANIEDNPMWSGTAKQYFELYATTAKLFKKEMPYVQIGGYIGYAPKHSNPEYFPAFLIYVKENNLPLDFFSWHLYSPLIENIVQEAKVVRKVLDEYGFANVKSFYDEWNCVSWDTVWGPILVNSINSSKAKQESFTDASSEVGASFVAGLLIEMLDLPIDVAAFYEGQATGMFCTIFDFYGNPTKQYYSFDIFNRIKTFGKRVKTQSEIEGIYLMASTDGNKNISAMITNNNANSKRYQCKFIGLEEKIDYKYQLYLVDKYRKFELVEDRVFNTNEIPETVYLYRNSVAYISIIKA